jgi:hypothetical protein
MRFRTRRRRESPDDRGDSGMEIFFIHREARLVNARWKSA